VTKALAPSPSPDAGPLRLAWLIDSLVTGGAEKLVVTFAEEAMRRPDVRLTVVALSDKPGPFRAELEALGVDLVVAPGGSLLSPVRFLRLLRLLRARRIEMIHAHLQSATVLGAAAAATLGAGFAVTVHNVKPSTRRASAVRRALYLAALRRRRARLVAVGRAVAEANAQDAGDRPFAVIPNAVSASAIWRGGARAAARAEMGAGPDETLLLAVGLLIPQKGYRDLLDAFATVAPRAPQARLAIVGDGRDSEHGRMLADRAAALGLSDRVRFLGLRRDVPRLLHGADLFVSASHWEGAPVSLLEAMINGLPCLMTDVGDNRLALEGVGCPVPAAQDVAGYAAALETALRDPAARAAWGDAARARVAAQFGVGPWVDRLLGLYAQDVPRRGWRAPVEDAAAGGAAVEGVDARTARRAAAHVAAHVAGVS